MLDLTPHAGEKRLFSVLRRRPEVDRMQALAMSIIERNTPCHRFPPLLIADQHTGAVNTDADRRYLADLRRGVAPAFFLRLYDRPDMCGQILQTGLEAGPAMVLLQVFQHLGGSAAGKYCATRSWQTVALPFGLSSPRHPSGRRSCRLRQAGKHDVPPKLPHRAC